MTPEDHDRLTRMRRCADMYPREFHDYAFLLEQMDKRLTELLAANSRLTAERDAALAEAEYQRRTVEFILRHNGIETLRRLESENQRLARERDDAIHSHMTARADADMYKDMAPSDQDRAILDAARKWAASIHSLRRAMRPTDSGKKGNVLEANQAYTAAHLALLALMADTSDK